MCTLHDIKIVCIHVCSFMQWRSTFPLPGWCTWYFQWLGRVHIKSSWKFCIARSNHSSKFFRAWKCHSIFSHCIWTTEYNCRGQDPMHAKIDLSATITWHITCHEAYSCAYRMSIDMYTSVYVCFSSMTDYPRRNNHVSSRIVFLYGVTIIIFEYHTQPPLNHTDSRLVF